VVLFLDEPTTGLDPIARGEMWQTIRDMVAGGTTVLLTTQYLDEADQLADHVALIDGGVVAARGTPSELRAGLGQARVRVQLDDLAERLEVRELLGDDPRIEGRVVSVPAPAGLDDLAEILARLRDADVEVQDITLEHPTLDEVFAVMTSAGEGALGLR
jgi:ABC-2 type transport system ATP-binding protein